MGVDAVLANPLRQQSARDATLSSGVGVFSVTLNTAGSQTITATDKVLTNPILTGASAPITARGLTVSSFTPAANGFSAVFSKPFIPADVAKK